MNWDAIGAVGEIVGAMAVVVSVVYLAVQVKKQTEEARLTATRELSNQYISAIAVVHEDKEFASIYLKAIHNYEALPDEDRLRVAMYIQHGFRVFEQQFLHTQRTVDPSFFESINLSYVEWLTFPGIQRWWELSNNLFEPRFRSHVDELMNAAKRKGYGSTFKPQQPPPNKAMESDT